MQELKNREIMIIDVCFVNEFLKNGGDFFTLQTILGHLSLEMVLRYLAIVKAVCEAAHRKASPVELWNA